MMTWQNIDFQGIASLDNSFCTQLQSYLEAKESVLSQLIANSISSSDDKHPPLLPVPSARYKFSEGVDAFARRLQQVSLASKNSEATSNWRHAVSLVNDGMWEYVELIEGSAVELFQQLDQVGFENWRPSLIKVVENIKDLLSHNIEDLKWAHQRLSTLITTYRSICTSGSSFWESVKYKIPFMGSPLDKSITRNLDRSQKFLNFHFSNFLNRYAQCQQLEGAIDKLTIKFNNYDVLNSLDVDEQNKFRELYRLLKMWEKNEQVKALKELDLIRSIRNTIDPQKASQIFKDYFSAIKNCLFDFSRKIKSPEEAPIDEKSRQEFCATLTRQRVELHTLGATIVKYREFLVKSDPSPYVRSNSNLSDWIIGNEPTESRPLQKQEYDIESLDAIFLKFIASFQHEPLAEKNANNETIYKELTAILHDMGQPLASKSMLDVRGNWFVDHLQNLDELSSTDPTIVDKVTLLFSRVLRADWKYNVLMGMSHFHELYFIHQGILGPSQDRPHLSRYGEFKRLIDRLLNWIKENKVSKHYHEIDLDISDIKGALQDLLAHVQRVFRDPVLFTKESAPHIIQELTRQLLEYRYLFGTLFYRIRHGEYDERLLRNQFLFVDQYFETIENKLTEMRNADWGSHTEPPVDLG